MRLAAAAAKLDACARDPRAGEICDGTYHSRSGALVLSFALGETTATLTYHFETEDGALARGRGTGAARARRGDHALRDAATIRTAAVLAVCAVEVSGELLTPTIQCGTMFVPARSATAPPRPRGDQLAGF